MDTEDEFKPIYNEQSFKEELRWHTDRLRDYKMLDSLSEDEQRRFMLSALLFLAQAMLYLDKKG